MNDHEFPDDILSAFLDSELTEEETVRVREAIATHPEVAARVVALSRANQLVKQQASSIDHKPLPQTLVALLDMDKTETAVEQIQETAWWHRLMPMPVASAMAALLLAIGLALWIPTQNDNGLANYEMALAQTPSGQSVQTGNGLLTSRFSFRDTQGRICRQYYLEDSTESSENIACYEDSGWKLVYSEPAAYPEDSEYQTASQSNTLQAHVSTIMVGEVLGLEEERALINSNWE